MQKKYAMPEPRASYFLSKAHFRDFARAVLLTFFKILIVIAFFITIYMILFGIVQAINIMAATGALATFISEFAFNHLGLTFFISISIAYWILCGCWRTYPVD